MRKILIVAALFTGTAALAQQPTPQPPAETPEMTQPDMQQPDPMAVPEPMTEPTTQADPMAPMPMPQAQTAPPANQSWNSSAPVQTTALPGPRPATQTYPRCTRQVTDSCTQRGGR